jgi:hypothetical protein
MPQIRLIDATVPEFGVPETCPAYAPGTHAARLDAFRQRLTAAGLDGAIVYADREHSANLKYLTDFDPRFEEAVLILIGTAAPVIVTGPENVGLAAEAPVGASAVLYPPFGLIGQDRSRTPPLADLLRAHGIRAGQRIGVCGWKYFGPEEALAPQLWLEVPAYLADTLRQVLGANGSALNANALLMHPSTGLRATNDLTEIARFEFAACHASEAVKRVIRGFRPGMREHAGAQLMQLPGIPLSCHPMLSTGKRAWQGLNSPSEKLAARGDAVTTAIGLAGALSCRAGWLVEDAEEIVGAPDYLERLAIPYFACAAEWYETIGIGVPGSALHDLVQRHLGDPFFGVFLNPGHLLHLDEWLSTPIYAGSTEVFRSGHAVQCDIIPATGGPYFTSNIEDGIALLDDRGRAAFAEAFPDAWARICERRRFMAEVLGIRLKPEVLPLSNLAAALPPFWLQPGRILAKA